MVTLSLLGTSGCHLCEEAEEVIAACLLDSNKVTIEKLDIAEQEQYQAGFALFIPVLYHQESLKRLNWPFCAEQIGDFISQISDKF